MLFTCGYSFAQTPANDSLLFELENISAFEEASALQKSLNSEFKAGAISGLSSREVPNIVSFITANDIQNTGARDLIDVLKLIPGFDFGVDVESAVGPALRGNWGMEGKILLLIDGIEMNELAYQTLMFGHHFPVDIIEKIEVIRGPGSATYGGTAEFGVINIITKGKSGPEGLNIYSTYSHLGEIYGRRQVGVAMKKSLSKAVIDLTASIGEGHKSDDTYINFVQDTFDLAKTKSFYAQPTFLNVGISSGKLEVRALYDSYSFRTPKYKLENKQISTYASYTINISPNTTFTPRISYTNQLPWHYAEQLSTDESNWYDYKVRAQRLAGNFHINHNFNRRMSLSSGLETQYLHAKDILFSKDEGGNFGDLASMSFTSNSLYSQFFWKHYFANVTAGLRYEYRNGFGGAVVPRLAATKHMNKWHLKFLYSHAYRMPGFENLNLAIGELKPETAKVAEAEAGYQFTPDMMFALNVFRTGVKDIIVYGFDAITLEESYINQKLTGSKGIEANFQIQKSKWRSQLTYSFYRPIKRNSVEDYQVEGRPDLYLGLAAHKLSFNGTVDVTKNLHLNTTAIWNSERWGYTHFTDGNEDEYVLKRFNPYLLLNFFARYENVLPHLHIGAGVHNLLDVQFGYIQPYAGENAPMSNPGQEWVLKLQYELPFKK